MIVLVGLNHETAPVEIREKLLGMVDLKAMGLDDVSQVKFTAISGEQFDYIGPSFFRE